ncbi:MAG: UvrD-helicase domain-containing protein [Bacteroidales bacterium]|nr:UvrD-helicase domain-containing protein [Bacteroidales bacterium]
MLPSSPILVIFSFAIIIAAIIAIYCFVSKRKFKQKVDAVATKTRLLSAALDELFKPVKRTTQEDVDHFLADNHDAINAAKEISETHSRFKDLLKPSGLYEFLAKVQPDALQSSLAENHTVYDAIDELTNLCIEPQQRFNALMAPDHYFAYSEMERFKDSLAAVEACEKKVFPKYAQFVTNPAVKQLLSIKKDIDRLRETHNKEFVTKELEANQTYFDTVLGKYPLDPQQRDSIVKLEDNCLVIASAGSGKTSTILGKAKYMVEKRNIDPSKVLLITFTRKAANELHERMKIEGVTCCTFHALAYHIISQVTGQAPSICDTDVPLNVFKNLILNNPQFLHSVNDYIVNQQSLMRLEHDYTDAFSYYEDRKKYGIQALFPDADGKMIFTRSEEEKRLVSLLTKWGVSFRYESPYQFNTATNEKRQYKPDFTIYYQDTQRQWKWVYLEHFGIDSSGNVPLWFGEGTRGGWKAANDKYKEGIAWKRATHRQYGTTLIETTSADFRNGTVEEKLLNQLRRAGVPIKERSDQELYDLLIQRNRKLEKSVYTLILSFITLMKANEKTIDSLLDDLRDHPDNRNKSVLVNIVKPFYEEYEKTLRESYEMDFTDAIIQATDLCREGLWKHYDCILVDEFQDISVDRYKFLQALRSDEPRTKLYCVGDDWQSIFRFTGSDMSLFYEFEKYFGHTELCKIETTHRFHQPLIDRSSEFIIKNTEQKVKTIKTPKDDKYSTYLTFEKCDGEDKDGVLKKVEELVAKLPPNQSILLLGRYNYDAMSVGFTGKLDMKDMRIMVKIGGREIPFLTVHSAKGLEADNVILVNCNQGAYGFPSLIEDDPILDFVLSKKESYPFAEERRLFYVAMTRARMHMYVLYDQRKPSPFISEFLLKIERGSYLCPKCLEGKIIGVKDGLASNGAKYRCYKCTNKESGCDFFEIKYGDLTPPGIKVTDDMTVQDVERLREVRRRVKK